VIRLSLSLTRSALVLGLLTATSCNRGKQEAANQLAASLIFDNASPEAREALATPVDFRLTDESYARWEEAQNNLDELPRSALRSPSSGSGTAIDRAIARLESSPRARRAIESAGLSVKDFVLETIALAQATEAAETGKSTSSAPIPPGNFQFVQRYRALVLRARAEARLAQRQAESLGIQADTAEEGTTDMNMQMEDADAKHAEEMRSEHDTSELHEHSQGADSIRSRDYRSRTTPSRDTARDTIRDTVPARR